MGVQHALQRKQMAKQQDSICNFMDMYKTSIPLKVEGKEEEKKKKGPMKKKQRARREMQ